MSDNIKVAVRMRDFIAREINNKATVHWISKDSSCIYQTNSPSSTYSFDRVFAGHESNEVVYSEFCSPIVKSVINGFNGTIFAYGQTSSGKTFTIMGDDGFNLGIAHYTVSDLFEHIQKMQDREFLLRVSYLEIYNEMVLDLLSDSNENLKLQTDLYGNIKVDKLTEIIVQEPKQVLDLMKRQKRTGETVMNSKSSRSHSIFRMIIESGLRGVENAAVNVSQFNLVDLAGSEKAGLNKGARFKEGVNINKSLLMLSQVISQLSGEKENQFINYRDSKLTRILQNSLGGNALTAIICTVTPASLEETTSTLKFAMRAKKIKNKPQVNEIGTEQALLKKYANKIKRLSEELEATKEEKNQETKICKNLQQQIENLKKNFVSHIAAPEISRAARRETWGGCLDAARLKMMFPPPKELLLPHELSGSHSDISNQIMSFTPIKKNRKTENDKNLSVLEEEHEGDIETLEASDISDIMHFKNRRSTFQSKCSLESNLFECLKTQDIAVQTEVHSMNESYLTVPPESENLRVLQKRCLDLEKELSELQKFTTLEKQMFLDDEFETNAKKSEHFDDIQTFPSISSVFSEKVKCSNMHSPQTSLDPADESLCLISSLVNSDYPPDGNMMNLDQEMFFHHMNIIIKRFRHLKWTCPKFEVDLTNISNPYLRVIFELFSMSFQSQLALYESSNYTSNQIQEILSILTKIFIGISSESSIDKDHSDLVEKFVNTTDVILRKLETFNDEKDDVNINKTQNVSMEISEGAPNLEFPDIINVSCAKDNISTKLFEAKESQTSMHEDVFSEQVSPSVCHCQEKMCLLEENIRTHLKTISDLQHECDLKEKQVSLANDKVHIQEQIIKSLQDELALKNKETCEELDIMHKGQNLKDEFTQTYYLDSNSLPSSSYFIDTEESDKGVIYKDSNNISNADIQTVDIERDSSEFPSTVVLKEPENFYEGDQKPISTEEIPTATNHRNDSKLEGVLKELVDLKIFTFKVMEGTMKKAYFYDITSPETFDDLSYNTVEIEIKILKGMLMRIEFYLKERAESYERLNNILDTKMKEICSLQSQFSTAEVALKKKEMEFANLSDTLSIVRENVTETMLKINAKYCQQSDPALHNTLNDIYLNDVLYLQKSIQKFEMLIEEKDSIIASLEIQTNRCLKHTQGTQTFEKYQDIASLENIRQCEINRTEIICRENASFKVKIEELNKMIQDLNCDIRACENKASKAKELYEIKNEETIAIHKEKERKWKAQMEEGIKSIEDKYEQEISNQENEFFERMNNKITELNEEYRLQRNKQDEHYKELRTSLEESQVDQISKLKEKFELDLRNRLAERFDSENQTRLKLEEEIKAHKDREISIKQSYLDLKNKFKEYMQDVKRKRKNNERSLKNAETQTHLEDIVDRVKKPVEICNECIVLKQQIFELKESLKTARTTKYSETAQENLMHELDLKKAKIITLETNNGNMVREISALKKELLSKSALLKTCNCRLFAKPKEMIEDNIKNAKTDLIPDVCIDARNGISSVNPKDVLQLDIVKKAICDAREEERIFLSSGGGPVSDMKCLVLQQKLYKKEKEILELKASLSKKPSFVVSENVDPIEAVIMGRNKPPTENKYPSGSYLPVKVHPMEFEIEKNFTPYPKSMHLGDAPKIRPKKILMEKNKIDPALLKREPAKGTNTEYENAIDEKERKFEKAIQPPECSQQ